MNFVTAIIEESFEIKGYVIHRNLIGGKTKQGTNGHDFATTKSTTQLFFWFRYITYFLQTFCQPSIALKFSIEQSPNFTHTNALYKNQAASSSKCFSQSLPSWQSHAYNVLIVLQVISLRAPTTLPCVPFLHLSAFFFKRSFFSYRMAGKVAMLIKNSEKVRDHADSIEMINILSTKDSWMIGMIWE